jgi:hypothetical protein
MIFYRINVTADAVEILRVIHGAHVEDRKRLPDDALRPEFNSNTGVVGVLSR